MATFVLISFVVVLALVSAAAQVWFFCSLALAGLGRRNSRFDELFSRLSL